MIGLFSIHGWYMHRSSTKVWVGSFEKLGGYWIEPPLNFPGCHCLSSVKDTVLNFTTKIFSSSHSNYLRKAF